MRTRAAGWAGCARAAARARLGPGAAVALSLALAGCTLGGCTLAEPPPPPPRPVVPPYAPYPDVADAVAGVSAENLRALVDRLAAFHTRHSLSDPSPGGSGIGAASAWIEAELGRYAAASGGRLRVERDRFVAPAGKRVPVATEMANVLATLPGAAPGPAGKRVWIVGAHYDTRCSDPMNATCAAPGADDDGSGTAAVMEMARALSLAPRPFDATIVFALFAGEEQGLLGSRHLAERARAEKWDLAGMATLDIVGRSGGTRPPRLRVFSEGLPVAAPADELKRLAEVGADADSPARALARFARATGEMHAPGLRIEAVWRADRYLRGGDHKPFSEAGWPAIRFTEPVEDYTAQHQDVRLEGGVSFGDLPDRVEADYLALVTRAIGATFAAFALAPGAPPAVTMDAAALANDTTLRWRAPADADVAGYEVLLRRTPAPHWESAIDVGAVTSVVVHETKDDVLFAVRAVDRDGHRGPAAFPVPVK